MSETERERLLMLLDECWIPGDGGMLFDHHMAPKIVKRAIDILADAPTSDESASEAQGIEVVEEGWMDTDELGWFQEGDFKSAPVYEFEPRCPTGEEPPTRVLIVRDTPEARRALGIEPREAEALREGNHD